MLVIFLFLLFWAGYSVLFMFIHCPKNIWYLINIASGLGAAIATTIVLVIIIVIYMSVTKPTNRLKHKIMHYISSFLLITQHIKLEVVGKEKLPKGTYVVYGNHKSMADAVIVYNVCNTVMSAAGKSTLKKVPLLPIIMRAYGVMLINRDNDRETAKVMIEGIKGVEKGLGMMIFPEGGIKTLETEEMMQVKPGAYKLATKSGVPIVPVSIIGSSKVRNKKMFRRTKVKIIIHDPIVKEEYEKINTIELGELVLNIINTGVKNG